MLTKDADVSADDLKAVGTYLGNLTMMRGS